MKQIHRVEVAFKDKNLDSIGFSTKNDIEEDLEIKGIETVKVTELYSFLNPISEDVVKKVLIDPLTQKFTIQETSEESIFQEYDFYIEVRLHEDVTDNVGIIAKEAIEDYLGKKIDGRVLTWKRYYFEGEVSEKDLERIAQELLANEVIEVYSIEAKK